MKTQTFTCAILTRLVQSIAISVTVDGWRYPVATAPVEQMLAEVDGNGETPDGATNH